MVTAPTAFVQAPSALPAPHTADSQARRRIGLPSPTSSHPVPPLIFGGETPSWAGLVLTGQPMCALRVCFRLSDFLGELCAVLYEHVPHMRGNLNGYVPVDGRGLSRRPYNEPSCNEARCLLTMRQNLEHPLLLGQKIGDDLTLDLHRR